MSTYKHSINTKQTNISNKGQWHNYSASSLAGLCFQHFSFYSADSPSLDNKQFYWPPSCREQCVLLQELGVWSGAWAQILPQVLTSCMTLDLLLTFSVLFSLFLGCAVFYQIPPVVSYPCPIFLKPATTSHYYGTFQFTCL